MEARRRRSAAAAGGGRSGSSFQPLSRGAPVAICLPSSPPDPERLRRGLEILSSRYAVVRRDAVRPAAPSFLAAADEQRAHALLAALDSEARAIFVGRGGYGALRILPALLEGLGERPGKPICGFSDATVLLELWQRMGWTCIHGPVVTQLPDLPQQDLDLLWRLLEDPNYHPHYAADDPGPSQPRLEGTSRVAGRTWGGNLATLASLAGVLPPPPPGEPRILVLEDVSEHPYRLDRYLTQLHLAGWFASVVGAALGSFTSPSGQHLENLVAARLAELGIPACGPFPWGHGSRNAPVPLGLPATLDLESATLHVDEPLTREGTPPLSSPRSP